MCTIKQTSSKNDLAWAELGGLVVSILPFI